MIINYYKKLAKKSLKIDRYTLKSGLLDMLIFIFILISLLLVAAFAQYYLANVTSFEQDYSSVMQQNSLEDSYNMQLLEEGVKNLNTLFTVMILILVFLVLLSFIFSTLIKLFQYRMLDKKHFNNFKTFIKTFWQTLRNTFPFFFVTCLIIFLLFVIKLSLFLIAVLILVLLIFYWLMLPFLRLISLKKKSFKKTWKYFFKNILALLKTAPVLKITVFISLILTISLGYLSNQINSSFLQAVISIIILFVIIYTYSSLRKYIYYTFKEIKNEK